MKLDGFYRGIIENNIDPLKMNRVQVRIFGIHSPDLSISTDSLPWAEQASSFAPIQGIGISSVPNNGTWVWVFFENGNIQRPVYFANAVGGNYTKIPEQAFGFRDKNLHSKSFSYTNFDGETFTIDNTDNASNYKFPRLDRTSSPDTNNLATGINLNSSIHASINSGLKTATVGSTTLHEPGSTNNKSAYPYCNVIESLSGHVIELDDTPSNERIRVYHKSGSYIEIKPDGTIVTKSKGTQYIISESQLNEMIYGAVNKYFGAGINVAVTGDFNINCSGKFNVTASEIHLND